MHAADRLHTRPVESTSADLPLRRNVPRKTKSAKTVNGPAMSDHWLTEKLAAQILDWKAARGRYIKAEGGWTPSWRFTPLTNLEQAFDLLDRAASAYTISTNKARAFQTEVRVESQVGRASGEPKARTITMALARALGLVVQP